MDFISAIKSGFANYATFTGRARRSEYWFWQLFTFLVGIALGIISSLDGIDESGQQAFGVFSALTSLVSLGLFLPTLAMLVRRLHDVGRSGWNVVYWGVIPMLLAFPMLALGTALFIDQALMGSNPDEAKGLLGLLLIGTGLLIVVAMGTVLFVFTLLDSKPDNKFGPNPKRLTGTDTASAAEGTTA